MQEALLSQTDRATRRVSRNLVNSCTTSGTRCTTNLKQIEVMELNGYSRPTCNKLCASGLDASTIIGVIHKLDRLLSFVDNTLIATITGGRTLPWVDEIRYFGTYIAAGRQVRCSITRAKRSFFCITNAILVK